MTTDPKLDHLANKRRETPATYQDTYNHRHAHLALKSTQDDLMTAYIGTVIDPYQRHRILHLFTDNNSHAVYVMTLLAGIWTCVS